MSNYIITLKPLTPYFFGGENTFGEDNTNYFVRSNYLPQQTTLLGFLRYELLAQNNMLGTDPKANKWEEFIGANSFQNKDGKFTEHFGAIKKISPVFLSTGSQHYIPQAMDWALCENEEFIKSNCKVYSQKVKPIQISLKSGGTILTNTFRSKIPELVVGAKTYDPKYGLNPLWVSSDGTSMSQWDWVEKFESGKGFDNGFFIEQLQTGIYKNKKNDDNSEAFYKQVFYKLIADFAFSFYANIDLPEDRVFQSRIVTMGGERSTFQMTVEPATDTFDSRFNEVTFSKNHSREIPALVLTSDAFADAGILATCDFAITDSVAFRSIKTVQKEKGNYAEMGETLKKANELLYLVKRGSIFYASDLQGVAEKLKNDAFQNIGYNRYVELKPNK